jgi:hypothetical protein
MPRLKNPSVGQVTYLVHFRKPQEKIRFTQGDAEVAFGSFGAGQSQQTNVPDDADPSLARIVFLKDKKNISISQMAVQLVHALEPQPTIGLREQFEAIKVEITEFHKQALEFKPASDYGNIAFVVQVNYPSDATTPELHKLVYDKFIAFQPFGELASINLTLGFKINDLFVNLGASVYETRQIEFKNQRSSQATPISILFKMEEARLISKGLQFTVDVNDRARHVKNHQIGTPDELFEMAARMLNEQLPAIVKGA